ncbi:FAD-binding and (Fe-S)-binding domain-containing protein [Profundibacterium mesophilum]|uniref:D-2-hydroxyglutarate dehydrogenase n=1 Tax=Profundibacterium mesophilum KAUST100406-0324 TaxID=1037889 RepID=A0A921TC44_9RHOB|nr:FAD-binding and (Fe-S)-binding domain-containing protein [Profundibacterium mesophilum]KAF0674671.1 D-lactate dehydrogenase [Profundibacterium mesophilum KAUST100406-0324]
MLTQAVRHRLERELEGSALWGAFDRGRYATDASIYQVMPAGVVLPRSVDDLALALDAAAEAGLPVTMRGGGTSQCGQTVNSGLIVDCARHMNRLLSLDVAARRAVVEPGIVLDELNRLLKPHGLWFPVDISTASRATIGGMVGNNSCGSRSLRYGTTRGNVARIEGMFADGRRFDLALGKGGGPGGHAALAKRMRVIGRREAEEIAARFPKVQRRVGGYNLDALLPGADGGLADLLVGSEGTLGVSSAIELKLAPLPPKEKILGVCHFASFRAAMEAAEHLVALGPTSVELVDATMIALAASIPLYARTLEQFLRGSPKALLLVEFADDPGTNARKAAELRDTMAGLGAPDGTVLIRDPRLAGEIGELRKAGLNIMMSMKGAGKPVSFVEDCAVPLPHLADYTDKLTAIFEAHGTSGTWYAHASEGCLHVRPVLDLHSGRDVAKMRSIAEQAFALVRDYEGSHSGEHGDGIVRSEFHEAMFGTRIVRAFEEVKAAFDPEARLNPGRIVHPPRMDDRSLMRYPPDYEMAPIAPVHDWSAWSGAGRGLQGAVEMCNNNGACRKLVGGVMCPSFRVTRNERDVTRGRANTLRLALTGQLGEDALLSREMEETLKLCVSCKACKRECPTGVDMARMKAEVLHQRNLRLGVPLRERLIAQMPRRAPMLRAARGLVALRNKSPLAAQLGARLLGFARDRSLPVFAADPFDDAEIGTGAPGRGREAVLFADTFTRWIEPRIPRAALRVLRRAGVHVHAPGQVGRPLCCGRTYLAAGMLDEAREEARRTIEALLPHLRAGRAIVGLEPSCLLTLRDEFLTLVPGAQSAELAGAAMLLEEFLDAECGSDLGLGSRSDAGAREIRIHGHCHQKAAGAMSPLTAVAARAAGTDAPVIASGCCGMAGAFGYRAETAGISRAMGELDLLPSVRALDPDTVVVANGTSCRHQISEGTGRQAVHIAELLDEAGARA